MKWPIHELKSMVRAALVFCVILGKSKCALTSPTISNATDSVPDGYSIDSHVNEQSAQRRFAYSLSVDGNIEAILGREENGKIVHQDIILGRVGEVQELPPGTGDRVPVRFLTQFAGLAQNAVNGKDYRWVQGIIPIEIDNKIDARTALHELGHTIGLLHYGLNDFGTSKDELVMELVDKTEVPEGVLVGAIDHLSSGDIETVRIMYPNQPRVEGIDFETLNASYIAIAESIVIPDSTSTENVGPSEDSVNTSGYSYGGKTGTNINVGGTSGKVSGDSRKNIGTTAKGSGANAKGSGANDGSRSGSNK